MSTQPSAAEIIKNCLEPDSGYNIFASTRTGPHHTANGEANQDSYGYGIRSGGMVLVAVADGAGSLSRSAEGSEYATASAVGDAMYHAPDESCVEAVDGMISRGVEAVTQHDDKSMGCTLAVAAIRHGEWAAATIGDSFVVVKEQSGEYHLITSDAHEFGNVTELVTSTTPTVNRASGSGAVSFAVSSDGLEQTTLKDRAPFEPFWEDLFARTTRGQLSLHALFDYMDTKNMIVDDTSLVIGSQRKEGS